MENLQEGVAARVVKHEFAGAGAAVQALGVAAPFALGFLAGWSGVLAGLVILIVLLVAGSMMSKKIVCSRCGNRLSDAGVKMCPTCRAEFPG